MSSGDSRPWSVSRWRSDRQGQNPAGGTTTATETKAGRAYANRGLRDDQLPGGDDIEWHTGDFAAGDVLVFHSHTIHKALPNLTPDRLRLSTDNRYTCKDAEVADLSRKSHYGL